MGRKVTENHKAVEQNSQESAEELIKQQNAAEDFVLGEREEENQEADTGKGEGQQEGGVIGAADQEEALLELPGDSVETAEDTAELTGEEEGQQKKAFERTVVLTGAATYLDSGVRYFKNKPAKVTDQRAYEQLLRTGLFVRV